MKWQKGSFTIEAVILIPLLLSMLLYALSIGIDFYKESMDREIAEELEEWDSVSCFYKCWIIKEQKEGKSDE